MKHINAKPLAQKILTPLDVKINGNRLWDIQVNNPKFYSRVLSEYSLALGESYMDGWWNCKALDQFFERILSAKVDKKVKNKTRLFPAILKAKIVNSQRRSRAHVVGKRHYDIGNRLFTVMLDKRMNYSCGYWNKATTLDDATIENMVTETILSEKRINRKRKPYHFSQF
jgi:cyclopropane-fatty-acyl-phospholipid synthase